MNSQKLGLRSMAVAGILSGLTMIMGAFGFGFIPLPTIKATIMHLPVIIGAIVEGPVVGGMIGLIFGLFSMYQNATAPTLLSPMFLNPLVSVLPRIIIGITAYYVYRSLKMRNTYLAIGAGAVVGSLTNTAGVLGMIYLLYKEGYANIKGISLEAVAGYLGTAAVVNGLPEAIIAAIITIPVVIAVLKVEKPKARTDKNEHN